MKCKICNREIKGWSSHLKLHSLSVKEYFDIYIEPWEHKCQTCGGNVPFISITKGYQKHCSSKCCNNDPEVKQKLSENIKKAYSEHNEESQQKRKETCMKKYGVDHPTKTKEVQEKMQQTCLERFGVRSAIQNKEIQEKIKKTNLQRYGVETVFQSKEIQNKIKHTNNEKYGVDYPVQNADIRRKYWKKYVYKNISFDSSWELAFYIYCEDHKISVEREPVKLTYIYNNKTYHTFPDFRIHKSLLIEFKRPDLRNRMKIENSKDNAKYKCLREHECIIYTKADKFLKYVKLTYGKTYLDLFKLNKSFRC